MDVTLLPGMPQGGAGGPDLRVFDSEEDTRGCRGRLARPPPSTVGRRRTWPRRPSCCRTSHHKSNMELPSSVAVATRTSVRPHADQRLGETAEMALIALNSPPPGPGGNR